MGSRKLRIDVLTLFPGMFSGYFEQSIMGRARERGILDLGIHNLRDWAVDRHRSVDDKPYGGGAGMVMMVNVIHAAVQSLRRKGSHLVLLSPRGELLTQNRVKGLLKHEHLILVCGHYEGVDERVRELDVDEEISIGDYVLSNGALAAMVLIDSVVRLLPGVLGDGCSAVEDSFYRGLLDYPHYTRPRLFLGHKVPDILLSGNHEKIRRWRRREALRNTLQRRPDLLERARLTREDAELLEEIRRKGKGEQAADCADRTGKVRE